MTVPFFVTDNITRQEVEVPQEIVVFCDDMTIDADREDLRYLDCVYMHMGFYGVPMKIMKAVRDEFYGVPVKPIFD